VSDVIEHHAHVSLVVKNLFSDGSRVAYANSHVDLGELFHEQLQHGQHVVRPDGMDDQSPYVLIFRSSEQCVRIFLATEGTPGVVQQSASKGREFKPPPAPMKKLHAEVDLQALYV
jgi:hypothetical protein